METDWECESAALAGAMADPLMVYLRSTPSSQSREYITIVRNTFLVVFVF